MIKNLWRRFVFGYEVCPVCSEQTVKWVKDCLVFEDEPPIMGHWQCTNPGCLVRTETESTPWADKIAQEQGYKTFKEAIYGPHRNKNGTSEEQQHC